MSAGSFIVLEGIDGAGTTTQLHRMTAWLQGEGHSAFPTFEPSDGSIGRDIRRILSGAESSNSESLALLFAADRLAHLEDEINPRLKNGTHVICDRYLGSSFAYQSVYSDVEWVRNINRFARNPDLTIYLRVSVDTAMERLKIREGEDGNRDMFEKQELLSQVAANYDAIYGVDGDAELDAVVIDASQDLTQVFLECCKVLQGILPE